MAAKVTWQGVFPAVTTQFKPDFSLDVAATHRVLTALIRDGASGLIVCGTVGENCRAAAGRGNRSNRARQPAGPAGKE